MPSVNTLTSVNSNFCIFNVNRVLRDRPLVLNDIPKLIWIFQSVRLELELKEEEVKRLTRDLEDLSLGGASEQDITQLRKAKHDMEKKIKEQVTNLIINNRKLGANFTELTDKFVVFIRLACVYQKFTLRI